MSQAFHQIADRSGPLVSFGVNAATGGYLSGHVDVPTLVSLARDAEQQRAGGVGEQVPPPRTDGERGWGGLELRDLSETGWGIVFAADEAPAIKDALAALIAHRGGAAALSYQPGESVVDWIVRNGGEPGAGDPSHIPYYLLLVGGPDKIPFEFQYGLDIEYGVGRVCFDSPDDYAQYAQNVRAYEQPANAPRNRKAAVLMGATNAGDVATDLSSRLLILPLAAKLDSLQIPSELYLGSNLTGTQRPVRGELTRETLTALLGGGNGSLPTVLVTASHGWAYPEHDGRQVQQQGALVCQGWRPGLLDPDPAWLFGAGDVPSGADLSGLVMFSFACFSAGTPQHSYYSPLWVGPLVTPPPDIAAAPFVAALPKKLLSRPNGPLGFVGHIEQTWASSFGQFTDGAWSASILAFQRAVKNIMTGYPLGYALADFNDRNATYSPVVSTFLEQRLLGRTVDEAAFATRWLQRNDARGFILLGDPGVAVRANELRSPA